MDRRIRLSCFFVAFTHYYADRTPPQAIPNVAMALGDTLYLGYRDGGRIDIPTSPRASRLYSLLCRLYLLCEGNLFELTIG